MGAAQKRKGNGAEGIMGWGFGGEGAGGSLNGRGSGAIDTGLYCPVQKTI